MLAPAGHPGFAWTTLQPLFLDHRPVCEETGQWYEVVQIEVESAFAVELPLDQ